MTQADIDRGTAAQESLNEFNEIIRHLPGLTDGTEKQIDWAYSLRFQLLQSWRVGARQTERRIAEFRAALADESNITKAMAARNMTREQVLAESEKIIEATKAQSRPYMLYHQGLTETSARWWIDHR